MTKKLVLAGMVGALGVYAALRIIEETVLNGPPDPPGFPIGMRRNYLEAILFRAWAEASAPDMLVCLPANWLFIQGYHSKLDDVTSIFCYHQERGERVVRRVS